MELSKTEMLQGQWEWLTTEIVVNLFNAVSTRKANTARYIPQGYLNRSFYILANDDSEWVLKVYTPQFSTEQVEAIATVVDRLHLVGVPVVAFQKGSDCKFAHAYIHNGVRFTYSISQFVRDLAPVREERLDKRSVEILGRTLAELHKALAASCTMGIPIMPRDRFLAQIDSVISEHETRNAIHDFFRNNVIRRSRVDRFIHEFISEAESLRAYLSANNNRIFQQCQCIHGDFYVGNVHLTDYRVVAIFDFDGLCVAPIAYELATTIVRLDTGFMFTEELFHTFLTEYARGVGMQFDRNFVSDVLGLMQFYAFWRTSRFFTFYSKQRGPSEFYHKYWTRVAYYRDNQQDFLTIAKTLI